MIARDPDYNIERTPPQNVELEMCVLGGIMLEPGAAYPLVAAILVRESFYLDGHGLVFEVMGALHARGIPPDSMAVMDELRSRNLLDTAGGAGLILSMMNSVPSAASVEHHARLVRDKALLRGAIRASTQVIEECYRQELKPGDIAQQMYEHSIALAGESGRDEAVTMAVGLAEYWAGLDERSAAVAELLAEGKRPLLQVGLPTGIYDLDRKLRGLRPRQLVLVAAATSMGKTAFGLQVAYHVAVNCGLPVVVFSLEMDEPELMERLLCMASLHQTPSGGLAGVSTDRLDSPNLSRTEWDALRRARATLEAAPIRIHTPARLTIADLRATLRREIREHGAVLAVVDYLGLMTADDGRAKLYEKMTQLTSGLKQTARELKIPLLVPAQLNRSKDNRVEGNRPTLSALRDSGSSEQDADIVIAIHREEYYSGQPKVQAEGPQLPTAELLILKNRNGPTTGPYTGIETRWYGKLTRFLPMTKGTV